MQYLGIDWGTHRAAWCAIDEQGTLTEGTIPADEDGLAPGPAADLGDQPHVRAADPGGCDATSPRCASRVRSRSWPTGASPMSGGDRSRRCSR